MTSHHKIISTVDIETSSRILACQTQLEAALLMGNPREEWRVLSELARAYQSEDRPADAIRTYHRALVISQEINDRGLEAKTWFFLAKTHDHIPENQKETIAAYQSALAICTETGWRLLGAHAAYDLGKLFDEARQTEEAVHFFSISLEMNQTPKTMARIQFHIGLAYHRGKKPEEAFRWYREAEALLDTLDDPDLHIETLSNLGRLCHRLGRDPEAPAFYLKALTIAQRMGGHILETNLLVELGDCYITLNQYKELIDAYKQALSLETKFDPKPKGHLLYNLGQAHAALHQTQEGLFFTKEALEAAQRCDDKPTIAVSLELMGYIYEECGDIESAKASLSQALVSYTTLAQETAVERISKELERLG